MGVIEVGQPAPPRTLPYTNEETVTLKQFRGKRTLHSVRPSAWTDIRERQMVALKRTTDALEFEKTRVLRGLWPHGLCASSLALSRRAGVFSQRASTILDEKGVVRFLEIHPICEAPDIDMWVEKSLRATVGRTKSKEAS